MDSLELSGMAERENEQTSFIVAENSCVIQRSTYAMSIENRRAVRKHMAVYSSDNSNLGQVAEVYEDSFLLRKGLLAKKRYMPYEVITSVADGRVNLSLSEDDADGMKWEKRPDYQHHLGDPTQLFYDRGHGVHDPFDQATPGGA
jgi:hypothetical protein